MKSVNDHKEYVLKRLSQMSGEYSALARASGCDPSTIAKLGQRVRKEGFEKVDMTVSTLSRLESYFMDLPETDSKKSLVESNADQAA